MIPIFTVIAALKAGHGIYRPLLRYALWMGRRSARARWFVLITLYVVGRAAQAELRTHPSLWPILGPALAAYILFALSTWLAEPISNLVLRLHPFGRLVLSKAEILASNIVATCLATAVVAGILFAVTSTAAWLVVAASAFLLLAPTSGAFSTHGTRAWKPLRALWIVLVTLGVSAAVSAFVAFDHAGWPLVALGVGAFAFGWIANYFGIKYS